MPMDSKMNMGQFYLEGKITEITEQVKEQSVSFLLFL